jgi:malonyl-CoA/methylmalonyl-CoA synthetase
MLGIVQQAILHHDKVAIISGEKHYRYAELLSAAESLSGNLLSGRSDLQEERVAFMVDPGFDYVVSLWSVWMAGGVAVPLCLTHPLPSLTYFLEDTETAILIASSSYKELLSDYCNSKNIRLIILGEDKFLSQVTLPLIEKDRMAMILYTSGTTNKPKGVVTTHHNIETQITTLVNAWEWNDRDHILCVLPLHHIHGIVNVVSCSLWSGAVCEFQPGFSAEKIFDLFTRNKINIFMAVPTIYFKLVAFWESQPVTRQKEITVSLQKFRLMVSGSAALPVSTLEKWQMISGHVLLERYGMTELGMALSNPLHGIRRPGFVGNPLPGVSVKLADDNCKEVPQGSPGEILVKGDNVFLKYWNREAATNEAFTEEGWFKTGDIAVMEMDSYRIMGRNSVDIIKSGGYKISALEIEEVLRELEGVTDCAVVGIPDEEWGEVVAAAVTSDSTIINEGNLDQYLRKTIAPYKLPRKYIFTHELPRNAMGKVTKNDVRKLFL